MRNCGHDDYLDPSDLYERPGCKVCYESEQTIDNCRDHLKEVVKQLYTKEPLDKGVLEKCLDELCYYLKVDINEGELRIKREKEAYLETWISFNNEFLKQQAI